MDVAFIVSNNGHQNLLSFQTSVKLGIVNSINNIEESDVLKLHLQYPKLFKGILGKLKEEEFEIVVDPLIKPIQQKLSKVPRQLQDLVTQELIETEKEGIIERVKWPTPKVKYSGCS